jgi:hypothetical protein
MSLIQNNNEVLDKSRKPLDSVEAPLRDQIPNKLAAKLEEKGIGTKVKELWNKGNANRAEWLERQQTYLQDWDEFLVNDATGPFEGSSQLHLPLTFIVTKSYHARFLAALLGSDPVVKARTEASLDRAALVQDVMTYAIRDWMNFNRGIEDTADEHIWNWCSTGSSTLKTRWACKYERFVDVQLVQRMGEPTKQINGQGEEISIPNIQMVEEEVPQTHKWEGPVADVIRNEDLLVIGGKGDPQLADAVIHRDRLTASELWTLADQKVFKKDVVEEIIAGGKDYRGTDISGGIAQQRSFNAGQASLDNEAELDRYEILEAYLNVDVDGDGIDSNVVVWVHTRTGKLCRATYLRRINKAGERPFAKIDFHKRHGQEMGVGLPELLYPLSKELDAIHNQRIDSGTIANMPFGFYRPTSSLEPVTIQLEPGALIPLDNPQTDVYFPPMKNVTSWGMQEEQGLQTWVERLTGMNDMSLGVLTGAQGATRTATGARALLGESNTNLDVYLRRLNRGWKQFLEYLFHLLQQRIPKGLAFRVTGESGDDYFAKIRSEEDIAGDFDFIIEANSANSNKQIQLELANQIVQVTGNPLDIQLGLVTPQARFEALKNWYKANGVKEYNRYVTKPPEYNYLPTPAEEIDRICRGINVPVAPNADHQGYLALWEEFKNSDELLGQISQDQTIACEMQARKHQQMAQAMQAQQAQQQNVDQMRMNATNAQNQAPTGLNPMAQGGTPNAQAQ